MGGGLDVDFTLDVRLLFGGRAGGRPLDVVIVVVVVSFSGDTGVSALKH